MNPIQRERYARQIQLPQIGEIGQAAILRSRVLIIGVGGLGSPVAMYLAAGGVGELVLTDYDRVDRSNLQRQIAHREKDLGESKASSAKRTLEHLNSEITVLAMDWQLDDEALVAEVNKADLVVDCSDNFPTRFAANDACVQTKTPLVSGAALRMEGQLMAYLPAYEQSPCYQCLYPKEAAVSATCSEEGILAPVVGVIGSLQATMAMQILAGLTDHLPGRLLLVDGGSMDIQSVQLPRNPMCPGCGTTEAPSLCE